MSSWLCKCNYVPLLKTSTSKDVPVFTHAIRTSFLYTLFFYWDFFESINYPYCSHDSMAVSGILPHSFCAIWHKTQPPNWLIKCPFKRFIMWILTFFTKIWFFFKCRFHRPSPILDFESQYIKYYKEKNAIFLIFFLVSLYNVCIPWFFFPFFLYFQWLKLIPSKSYGLQKSIKQNDNFKHVFHFLGHTRQCSRVTSVIHSGLILGNTQGAI